LGIRRVDERADSPTSVPPAHFEAPAGAAHLLLVRHGESAHVVADRADRPGGGPADPPLSPRGREEAVLVGARLADEPIAAIYVTNLQRTAETARPLAATIGVEPVVEPDLREVFLGDLDGLNLQLRLRDGDEVVRRALREERWELLPGAEAQEAFAARVRAGITRIAERHREETVAIFTHGGVIGQTIAEATACRPHSFTRSDNGSITHLVVTGRRWHVRAFNDSGHLRRSMVPSP
jgi:2,3-bisphosphoglycerate-dependent phosphoglycerate mutase